MAGQLTIDTLKASTGVLATQNGMSGIAKAWVNFNGTTNPATIRKSMNVSSVTYDATGMYTINFTTPMDDANYSLVGTCGYRDGTNNVEYAILSIRRLNTAVYSTTQCAISTLFYNSAGNMFYTNVAVFD